MRNTALSVSPGPYNQEEQSSYELGVKSDSFDRHLRVNAAVFHNTINNLQRDVNTTDPIVGTVQVTRNVGSAEINGAEIEVTAIPVANLTLSANLGYLDGKYTKLSYDLNGAAPGLGLDLRLARLVPWSYGASIAYEVPLAGEQALSLRVAYGHRDRTPFTDNNTGYIYKVNDLSASATWSFDQRRARLSLYGKNLLNEVTNGADAPLPGSLGGGFFNPINEGRVIGLDLRFEY